MGERAVAPRCRRDLGLTITEMLVALLLTGLLSAAALQFMVSFTRHDEQLDDRLATTEAIEQIHAALVRDAHRADSVAPVAASDYDSNLPFVDSTTGELVVWVVDNGQLVRYETEGGELVQRVMLDGVLSAAASFRYFGPDGREIDPLTVPVTTMTYCTTRVSVSIVAVIDGDELSVARDLAFRSRQPGSLSC